MNTTNVDGFWSLQLRVDEDNGERIVIEKEAEVLIDSRITVRLTTNNQRREERTTLLKFCRICISAKAAGNMFITTTEHYKPVHIDSYLTQYVTKCTNGTTSLCYNISLAVLRSG